MKLALKHSVVPNLTVEAAVVLGWVAAQWDEWEGGALGDFVVTSAKDGQHGAGSMHRHDQSEDVRGEAIDIRTWHLWHGPREKADDVKWADIGEHDESLHRFARFLQAHGLRVVVHPEQAETVPHLHVAVGRESAFVRVD